MAAHNLHPLPSKLSYFNFHPPEVVGRYRAPQLQVDENYSYWSNLKPNIFKSWCLKTHFIPTNSDFIGYCRDSGERVNPIFFEKFYKCFEPFGLSNNLQAYYKASVGSIPCSWCKKAKLIYMYVQYLS